MPVHNINNHHSSPSNLSKIVTIGLILTGIALGLSFWRNMRALGSANTRISEAAVRLNELEAKNEELKYQAIEVDSPSYREKLMRDQLGLAQPGESVLIMPDQAILRKLSPIVPENVTTEVSVPNWQRWMELFF